MARLDVFTLSAFTGHRNPAVLCDSGICRPYAEKYAADQDLFFKDYVAAHLKLSELGAKWEEVWHPCLIVKTG